MTDGENDSVKIIPSSLQPIALALHQGNWHAVANAVFETPSVSTLVTNKFLAQIQHECQILCGNSSKFKLATPESLQSFSWRVLANELKANAPLFFAVLQTAGGPHRPRNTRKGVTEELCFPALCTAAPVLLKERCERVDAVQQLIGLILFKGNASKQVILHNNKIH